MDCVGGIPLKWISMEGRSAALRIVLVIVDWQDWKIGRIGRIGRIGKIVDCRRRLLPGVDCFGGVRYVEDYGLSWQDCRLSLLRASLYVFV